MTAAADKPKTLYQRIADVQAELDSITPTGKNAFKAEAISIDDVENTLRAPMAKAGVVTRWSYVELGVVDDRTWRAHLRVTVVNAEHPDDKFEDEWIDVGGNPMAATSFARKGYLKALFHLAEPGDATGNTPTGQQRKSSQEAPRAASTARTHAAQSLGICTECRDAGYQTRSGKPPTFYESKASDGYICNGIRGRDDAGNEIYAKHEPRATEAEQQGADGLPPFDFENARDGYAIPSLPDGGASAGDVLAPAPSEENAEFVAPAVEGAS